VCGQSGKWKCVFEASGLEAEHGVGGVDHECFALREESVRTSFFMAPTSNME